MANKSVSSGITEIDPMFFIPEGVGEFVYEAEEDSFEEIEGDNENDFVEETNEVGPAVPEILGVLQQTLRRGPGGQQVVDVTFDVSESYENYEYEFRVVKV